jgi:hypothetical protein
MCSLDRSLAGNTLCRDIVCPYVLQNCCIYFSEFLFGEGFVYYKLSCNVIPIFSKFIHCNENQYITYIIDVISQLYEALFDVELFNEIQGKNSHTMLY